MGDEIAPVFTPRPVDRRSDDLEVFRIIGISADDELVLPMLDVIFDTALPLGDQLWRGLRRCRVDQIGFRRLMVMRVDDEEAVGLRLADAGEEALDRKSVV